MSPFLEIASRVEAAIEAYTSIRDFADEQVWKEGFKKELKNTLHALQPYLSVNPPSCPDLHPTLIALTIVLHCDEDLGMINRSHPDLENHKFYKARAEFPDDILDLLPSGSADRWWERLAEAACRECPTQTTEAEVPPIKLLTRLKIKGPQPLPDQPRPSRKGKGKRDSAVSDKDMPMEVEEELKDHQRPERSNVAKGAAAAGTKKQKGSTTASDSTVKRPAKLTKRSEPAEQSTGVSNTDPPDDDPRLYDFQCDRCFRRDQACSVDPDSACRKCKQAKQGCSLFPKNPNTKKADRRPWTRLDFLIFREKQKAENAEKCSTILEKRKRRACGSPTSGDPEPSALDPGELEAPNEGNPEPIPDAGDPEPSVPVPSPSLLTAGLGAMTLDSGALSAVNTPAKSPTMVPQHTLPQNISPAPPAAPEPRRASSCAAESPTTVPRHSSPAPPTALKACRCASNCLPSTNFMVEVPSTSQFLRAAHWQSLRSCSDASLASDDGSLSTRIAAAEKKQEQLETWMRDIDNRLKQLEE